MEQVSNYMEVGSNSIVSNVKVYGLENTMRVAKFPMAADVKDIVVDDKRLSTLAKTDSSEGHDNALLGIVVQFDLSLTIKAWTEAERYHFFDIVSSQSTMHRITSFDLSKAYSEYTSPDSIQIIEDLIDVYNTVDEWWGEKEVRLVTDWYTSKRETISKTEWKKRQYLRILYSNPVGLKLTAGMSTNYRQLKTIYKQRKAHRLPEWKLFCEWVESLPYSYLITQDDGTDE